MSHFLITSQGNLMALAGCPGMIDHRVRQSFDKWDNIATLNLAPWTDGNLWPNTRFCGGVSPNISEDAGTDSCFELGPVDLGNQARKQIQGTARDQFGNPLPAATIKAYLTATDVEVGQTTSDAAGTFHCPTTWAGSTHYLVAYLAGSPDVSGTSVNTLIPT